MNVISLFKEAHKMVGRITLTWVYLFSIAARIPMFGNSVDDQLHQFTTLMEVVSPRGSGQATGFFYNQLAPPDPKKTGPQWRALEKTWLVTNRHVLLPFVWLTYSGRDVKQEVLPSLVTFNLRRVVGKQLRWEPISIDTKDLLKRAKCHPDSDVDVCVIEVGDLIMRLIKEGLKAGIDYMSWGAISKEMFPGGNNKLSVESTADVIVAGYPQGFYDDVNLFPVIKEGVIGSRWGSHFKGKPCFLIDGQMFPGSSGSIVISKPTHITFDADGRLLTSKEKQFAVLGILSGEWWDASANRRFDISTSLTLLVKGAVNTGIVWYGSLIEDIITTGVTPKPVGSLTPSVPSPPPTVR